MSEPSPATVPPPAETDPAELETVVLGHGPLQFTSFAAGPAEGEVVICLHGFPDNARSFRAQLPALAAAGYRAYAPTMRGYEPSSQPAPRGGRRDYSIAAMTHDLLAWIDGLGQANVHLVGHDWGAIVAYAAAALAPARFASLTTIAVPPVSRFVAGIREVPSQVKNSWYVAFFQLPRLPERVVPRDDWALIRRLWADWSPGFELPAREWAQLRETFAAPGVCEAMLAYYRQNLSPRGFYELGKAPVRIPVPTLAVTGADDGCCDTRLYDHTVEASDFPAGIRVERIADAGHFVHQERPQAFNELLLAWLSRWARAPAAGC